MKHSINRCALTALAIVLLGSLAFAQKRELLGSRDVTDLRGNDRVIRSIDFWYEAKSVGRRGATVRAFGRT